MTIIYLTEHNTKCYGVTFQKDKCINVQKSEDISDDEKNVFCVKPSEVFLDKSEKCNMTAMSGAFDKTVFDRITFLLKTSEENNKHRYVYTGGNIVCSFLTYDNFREYISNMNINLTPNRRAISEENISFLTPHFKIVKRENINDDELLKTNKNSVFPYDYHVSNCGRDSF